MAKAKDPKPTQVRVTKTSSLEGKHAYEKDGYAITGEMRDLPTEGSIFMIWQPIGKSGKPITSSPNSTWNAGQVKYAEEYEEGGGTFTTEDATYEWEAVKTRKKKEEEEPSA